MTADSHAAVSRRILEEAFNEGNLSVFDECCSPDLVTHDPAEAGDVRGIEAHKQRVATYRAAMSDLFITADDTIAAGDQVVIRWSVSGTNDGEFMGMPATGRQFEMTGTSIDRFDEDGRIVEVWDQWDNFGFMQQLGLFPDLTAVS